MPAPRPPAGLASWSASTSSRVRPTTSRKSFRSASPLPPLPGGHRPHRQIFSYHQQRLRRILETEHPSVLRARIQTVAADEQRHRAALADCLVQPDTEHILHRIEQVSELRDREPAPAQIGQYLELDDIERGVAAFGKAAGLRP